MGRVDPKFEILNPKQIHNSNVRNSKERLVIEHSGNRDSYVDGKHDFIQELNRRAKEWKDSIEW